MSQNKSKDKEEKINSIKEEIKAFIKEKNKINDEKFKNIIEKIINLEDKLNKNLLEINNNLLSFLKFQDENNKSHEKVSNIKQINKENKNKKISLI